MTPLGYEGDYFNTGTGDIYDTPVVPVYCVYNLPMQGGGGGPSCPTGGQTTNQTTSLQWEWNVQHPNIAMITSGSNTATAVWKGMSAGNTPFTAVAMVNEENSCTGTGTMNVAPSITQSQNLWYFGGNPSPSGFTLGGTTATLTASGGGNGTYTWSITAGSSKASLQGTTSGNNLTSVTIASAGYGTSAGDVTVQLVYTPTEESGSTTTYSLSVDSPYKLVAGSITDRGVTGGSCGVTAPNGTSGFQSLLSYTIMSFFGGQITNIPVNESFGSIADDYVGTNWPTYAAGSFTSNNGTFADDICVIFPAGKPPSLPPQSPLGNTKIDHGSQAWFIGSLTEASGVEVQSDTLQRYQDHGRHLSIVSPTR